ncbi:MAG TPA: serine/threonine-protein kinase [Gemmatimonadaceae bacterium]|nr:serine/threonine-protein kinase [Gemmatimonadaceae bacterium]
MEALVLDSVVRGPRLTPTLERGTPDIERDLVARELTRQYQVVRPLGRGGMGAVYLARDVALHRHVALKVLRNDLRTREDARERFRAEARLSAQLEHPGIVPLYAFGETARVMYMAMRYVPGDSLGDRIRAQGRLAPGEARLVLIQIARALDYAHAQGVVHRDLKPENVLVDRETGRALLADFSVARRRSWDPRPSELRCAFGTPHFMSPEQAVGEADLDGRSDLYGLGVLGYLMLAGRLPFTGESFAEISAKHMFSPVPPLASLAPGAPRDLIAAVERCLEKQLDKRWQYGRQLAEALDRGAGSSRFGRAFRRLVGGARSA